MGIKSEKTFEEIVERIIAVFRPQKSAEARHFVDCDLDHGTIGGSNATVSPTPQIDDVNVDDNGTDSPAPGAASQDIPAVPSR